MNNMRKLTLTTGLTLAASPALAAGEVFFSLANTDFIVVLGFIVFLAVLVYFKVPGLLGGMLDKRADGIRDDLNEARSLREEAQTLLASYDRKQREVKEQAKRIVAHAREEAHLAAEEAKADLEKSIARRLAAADDQIESAKSGAVKEVRDRAVAVAVAAAREVLAAQMTKAEGTRLIDTSIDTVAAKLH